MLSILFKKLLMAIPTLIAVSIILFFLIKSVPGDPAQLMLGDRASAETLAKLRHEMGLDKPLWLQYFDYSSGIITRGDFGNSIKTGEKVSAILKQKIPATIELALFAMLLATLLGIPAGILAARFPGSLVDFSTMSTAVVGVSIPVFWLGLIFMWIFSLQLGWFPLSGRMGIEFDYEPYTGFLLVDSFFVLRDPELFLSGLKHLVLPACTVSTIPMAFLARITRASMLDVLKNDYIRTAKAKGSSLLRVYLKHALKNASLPISTMFGLQFGTLLGGAVITETIFAWPGLGSWILASVSARDLTAVEGGVLAAAFAVISVNTLIDVTYHLLDPRLSHEEN